MPNNFSQKKLETLKRSTGNYHRYSATDIHLYELFKMLKKLIRNENNVEIFSNVILSEDLSKVSNKSLTARHITISAHKKTKKLIIIRNKTMFNASHRNQVDFKETIFEASTTEINKTYHKFLDNFIMKNHDMANFISN